MPCLKKCLPRVFTALLASALLVIVFTTTGCFAVLVGAGAGATVAYMRGDLDVTLGAGFTQSVRAARNTLTELKYARIRENQDALQATLIYRSASDQKVELYLGKLGDDATKLKIRVGTFGDESLQNEILTRIKAGL